MGRTEQLANKRHALRLQCASQRQQIAHLANDIESRLVTADRVLNVVSFFTRSPVAIVAVIAGTVLLRPWRLMKWATQGALLLGMAKRLKQLVAKE
jgi:hypothetical protein